MSNKLLTLQRNSSIFKKTLVLCLLMAVSVFCVYSQKLKSYEPNTYYYNSARQSIDNGDYATAYDYLNKELASYPNDGHAYFWKGFI